MTTDCDCTFVCKAGLRGGPATCPREPVERCQAQGRGIRFGDKPAPIYSCSLARGHDGWHLSDERYATQWADDSLDAVSPDEGGEARGTRVKVSPDPLSDKDTDDWLNEWADLDKHPARSNEWRAGYEQAVRDVWDHLFGPDDEVSP